MRSSASAAYRFSVAWPRIGRAAGPVNAAGLGFYDRLVDELLAAGVGPTATLYHWDLPQELEDAGGWTNRDTALRFGDYAGAVAARLGDRVRTGTLSTSRGARRSSATASGEHAPGRATRPPRCPPPTTCCSPTAWRPALRAQAPRGRSRSRSTPARSDRSPTDRPTLDAARRIDGLLNRIFLEPLLRGRTPPTWSRTSRRITDMSYVRGGDLRHRRPAGRRARA